MGVTTFDQHLIDATAGVTARLRRIVGDPAVAEDLCQERSCALAWRPARPAARAPARVAASHGDEPGLRRAASPGASRRDRLRRRAHRRGGDGCVGRRGRRARRARRADSAPAARPAAALRAGVVASRAGRVLDIGEDAARKRVARAREAFAAALRRPRARHAADGARADGARRAGAPTRQWLERAGARVRIHGLDAPAWISPAPTRWFSPARRPTSTRARMEPRDPRSVDPDLTATCATWPRCGPPCATTSRSSASAGARSC